MKYLRIITFTLSILVFAASCKKDFYEQEIGGDIYPSEINYKNIVGKWTLTDVTQKDETSLTGEFLSVLDFFNNSKLPNIEFMVSNTDTTYQVDTIGLKINYFGSPTGKWHFDNKLYPKKIILNGKNGDSTTISISKNLLSSGGTNGLIEVVKEFYCPDPEDPTKNVKMQTFSAKLKK